MTARVVCCCGEQTIDLLGDQASTYTFILQASCYSQPATPTCHPGGTAFIADECVLVVCPSCPRLCCRVGDVSYQNVPDDYHVFCPKPLGLAEPRDGLQMEKLEGTACALPCPPVR